MEITCKNNVSELNTRDLEEIKGGFRLMYPGQGLAEMILKSILGAYESGYDKAQEYCEC